MKKITRYGLLFLLFLVSMALAYREGSRSNRNGPVSPTVVRVDTLTIHDTIRATEPVYTIRRVVDSVLVPVTDTLTYHDTLFVYLEREQLTWQDSLSRVYVSGIRPSVDSVVHYTTTRIITRDTPVRVHDKWSLGVQAGLGASKDGLTPYIGLGVTYNILSW